jgi:hypothetical protein
VAPPSHVGPTNGALTSTGASATWSQADRFIPNRQAMDMDASHFQLTSSENLLAPTGEDNASPSRQQYRQDLASNLFDGGMHGSKILAFKAKAPEPKEGHQVPTPFL